MKEVMTHPLADPLTDPALNEHYRTPRSAEELCRIAHQDHMIMVDQEGWLKQTFERADERRAADEHRLERDLEIFRETGKMPKPRTVKKGRHS